MIHCAIVEDDKQACDKLCQYLKRFSAEKDEPIVASTFQNAIDFLSEYYTKYDVVFMDIEMPMMNGMEAAHRLRELDKNVCLVFVTNMSQFAVKGYEVEAMGYMVKPIDYFAFSVQMNKVVERLSNRRGAEILVKTDDYVKRILIDDLYYVEVMGHYVVYHTTDGNYRELGQMSKLEAMLPKGDFFRCNNCYLVNLRYTTEIKKNVVKVGKDEVLISRRRRKDFLLALNDYFGRINA